MNATSAAKKSAPSQKHVTTDVISALGSSTDSAG